jgi:hypothetical protein
VRLDRKGIDELRGCVSVWERTCGQYGRKEQWYLEEDVYLVEARPVMLSWMGMECGREARTGLGTLRLGDLIKGMCEAAAYWAEESICGEHC